MISALADSSKANNVASNVCPVYFGFGFFFAYTSAFMKVQKVVLEFDQDLSKENYSML